MSDQICKFWGPFFKKLTFLGKFNGFNSFLAVFSAYKAKKRPPQAKNLEVSFFARRGPPKKILWRRMTALSHIWPWAAQSFDKNRKNTFRSVLQHCIINTIVHCSKWYLFCQVTIVTHLFLYIFSKINVLLYRWTFGEGKEYLIKNRTDLVYKNPSDVHLWITVLDVETV